MCDAFASLQMVKLSFSLLPGLSGWPVFQGGEQDFLYRRGPPLLLRVCVKRACNLLVWLISPGIVLPRRECRGGF